MLKSFHAPLSCTHHMDVKGGVIPAALWWADDVLKGERVVEALLL